MRRFIVCLLALILLAGCYAIAEEMEESQEIYSGDYSYKINEDHKTITITHYFGNEKKLDIPAEIDGYSVTVIGTDNDTAISGKTLTEVTLPETVTTLKISAFCNCDALKKIVLNEGLTTIENTAIIFCPKLTEIVIPRSIEVIGPDCFIHNCPALEKITIPEDHPVYKVIDGVLFNQEEKILLCYPAGKKDKEYQIPEGTEILGYGAFSDSKLSKITLPDSITTIDGAFLKCNNLKEISIPAGVTKIGYMGGTEMPKLERFVVDENNPAYESIDGVLYGKIDHTLYSYPFGRKGNTYEVIDGTEKISSSVFKESKLTEVKIPETLKELGPYAFLRSKIKKIILPDDLETIGYNAFNDTDITSINIPANVRKIEGKPFQGCNKLAEIIVDENNPFYSNVGGALVDRREGRLILYPKASKNKTITIPGDVKIIEEHAFEDSNLEEIILLEGVETIKSYAFLNCKKAKLIVLPASLKEISTDAFLLSNGKEDVYWSFIPNMKRKISVVLYSYAHKTLEKTYGQDLQCVFTDP